MQTNFSFFEGTFGFMPDNASDNSMTFNPEAFLKLTENKNIQNDTITSFD